MKFSDLIEEFEALASSEGLYSRDKIAWWLIKYEERYAGLSNIKNTLEAEFPNRNLRELKEFIKELLFIELYERLDKRLENTSNISSKEIDLNDIIVKIKTSTNGLNRKDKDFKWDKNNRG